MFSVRARHKDTVTRVSPTSTKDDFQQSAVAVWTSGPCSVLPPRQRLLPQPGAGSAARSVDESVQPTAELEQLQRLAEPHQAAANAADRAQAQRRVAPVGHSGAEGLQHQLANDAEQQLFVTAPTTSVLSGHEGLADRGGSGARLQSRRVHLPDLRANVLAQRSAGEAHRVAPQDEKSGIGDDQILRLRGLRPIVCQVGLEQSFRRTFDLNF